MADSRAVSSTTKAWIFFGAAIGITIIAWAVLVGFYLSTFGPELSDSHTVWAQFGDYVGGVLNPILGTLTLIGILYTVMLQRDVLSEATRAERNQRVLNQQQGFETAFFHMLDAVNTRVTQANIVVPSEALRMPISDTAFDALGSAGSADLAAAQQVGNGAEAFAVFIRLFRPLQAFIKRGDYPESDVDELRRDKAQEFFGRYDYVVGPVMRSMSDLLVFVDDFDRRSFGASDPRKKPDTLLADTVFQPPEFYAGVATNSRTRFEIKVFAMYVGARIAPSKVAEIAKKYKVFEIIESDWWGRSAFLS